MSDTPKQAVVVADEVLALADSRILEFENVHVEGRVRGLQNLKDVQGLDPVVRIMIPNPKPSKENPADVLFVDLWANGMNAKTVVANFPIGTRFHAKLNVYRAAKQRVTIETKIPMVDGNNVPMYNRTIELASPSEKIHIIDRPIRAITMLDKPIVVEDAQLAPTGTDPVSTL